MRRLLSLAFILVLTACSASTPTLDQAAPTSAVVSTVEAPADDSPAEPVQGPEDTATTAPTAAPEAAVPEATATQAAAAPTATPAPVEEQAAADPGANLLAGTAWEWAASDNPGCDLLVFNEGGALSFQADCTAGTGSYRLSGSTLQLSLPVDVRGDFGVAVEGATAYALRDSMLALTTPGGEVLLIPQTMLSGQPPAEGSGAATLKYNTRVYMGPGLTYPVLGFLPAGSTNDVSLRIYQYPFWGVTIPGMPDNVGWVPASAADVTAIDSIPYTAVELLQVGGDALLWPDLDDPRASVSSEVRMFAGPGENYHQVMVGLPGDTFYVLGKSEDGSYLAVLAPFEVVPTGIAWVLAGEVETRNVEMVRVMKTPPPPGISRYLQPASGQAYVSPYSAVNIRGGPGVEYTVFKSSYRGEIYLINAVTPDGIWYRIEVPESVSADRTAWISAPNVRAVNAETVPVVEYPFPMPYPRTDTLGPSCVIVSQTPGDYSIIGRGVTFDLKIEIRNNSDKTWSRGDIDFVYIDNIDNAPMHTGADRLDLEQHVTAGSTTIVEFEARAPTKHPGVFGERWVVRKGGETVCAFTYQMRVK